jgi:hypothetical protein
MLDVCVAAPPVLHCPHCTAGITTIEDDGGSSSDDDDGSQRSGSQHGDKQHGAAAGKHSSSSSALGAPAAAAAAALPTPLTMTYTIPVPIAAAHAKAIELEASASDGWQQGRAKEVEGNAKESSRVFPVLDPPTSSPLYRMGPPTLPLPRLPPRAAAAPSGASALPAACLLASPAAMCCTSCGASGLLTRIRTGHPSPTTRHRCVRTHYSTYSL